MRAILFACVFAAALVHVSVVNAANATLIPMDARIFVEPGTGFDVYLTAALEKRHVPLTVTTEKSKADYAIESESGIRLVNLRNGDVVFAWPMEGKAAENRRDAEACARTLAHSVQAPSDRKPSHRSKDPVWDF